MFFTQAQRLGQMLFNSADRNPQLSGNVLVRKIVKFAQDKDPPAPGRQTINRLVQFVQLLAGADCILYRWRRMVDFPFPDFRMKVHDVELLAPVAIDGNVVGGGKKKGAWMGNRFRALAAQNPHECLLRDILGILPAGHPTAQKLVQRIRVSLEQMGDQLATSGHRTHVAVTPAVPPRGYSTRWRMSSPRLPDS